MDNNDFLEPIDVDSDDTLADIILPSFKNTSLENSYDYLSNIYDYEDMEELAKAINTVRIALMKVTDLINQGERRALRAKTAYERHWNRCYNRSEQRTEAAKKADADILSEQLEDQYLMYHQLIRELNRQSNALRSELNILSTVSNNIRLQLRSGSY